MPASCERATRSARTIRASTTVTIGYSDASTDVMLTRPLADEAANSRLPNMSPKPMSASHPRTRPGTPSEGRWSATTARITLVDVVRKISEAHCETCVGASRLTGGEKHADQRARDPEELPLRRPVAAGDADDDGNDCRDSGDRRHDADRADCDAAVVCEESQRAGHGGGHGKQRRGVFQSLAANGDDQSDPHVRLAPRARPNAATSRR